MKPIVEIPEYKIIDKVVSLVDKTIKGLLVTTSLRDSDLPKKYNLTLRQVLDRGIKVERYCFGSLKKFKEYQKMIDKRIKLFLVRDQKFYQRLIISDNSKMFFKIGKHFFYTENPLIIKGFVEYIRGLKFTVK